MVHQEKIFSKEECERIINYSKLEDNKPTFIQNSKVEYFNNRIKIKDKISYNIYKIYNTNETEWMFNKLLKWFSEKNNVKLNDNSKPISCTLHQYIIGDKFIKHTDLNKGFEDRRYNVGIQLNVDYEGGEYLCYDINDKPISISKEIGTALSYHGRVPHEIKEITNGSRWSIVMPIHNWEIIEKQNLI